ncbi:putative F-box-like domain superfamily protein [Tanacetum coccineum]
MPPDVISNILDRLPTQDAVRTDILARNWWFNWTMITQLIFDDDFFQSILGSDEDNEFNGRSLSRLLIHLKGPITKFVLYIDQNILNIEDIDHWILFISRNGIKDLTLENADEDDLFKLPTQLYSCMELEHLKLENCCFRHSPSFRGFPNLLSLDFSNVEFQSYTFGEFISRSPLLEILKFRELGLGITNAVKISDIAKLRNLKTLSLSWSSFDFEMTIKSSSIFQLVGLPKLQELALDFWMCDTLEIKACDNYDSPETLWSLKLDPKTAGPLQLLDVAFPSFRGSKNEVKKLSKKLQKLYRASSVARIEISENKTTRGDDLCRFDPFDFWSIK